MPAPFLWLCHQVAELLSDRDRLQKYNEVLRRDLAEAQGKVEAFENRAVRLESLNNQIEADNQRLEKELGEAEVRLWDVEKERDVLRLEKDEHDRALREEVSIKEAIQEELLSVTERAESLSQRVDELKAEKRQLSKDLKSAVRLTTEEAAMQCTKLEQLGIEVQTERTRATAITKQFEEEKADWEKK